MLSPFFISIGRLPFSGNLPSPNSLKYSLKVASSGCSDNPWFSVLVVEVAATTVDELAVDVVALTPAVELVFPEILKAVQDTKGIKIMADNIINIYLKAFFLLFINPSYNKIINP